MKLPREAAVPGSGVGRLQERLELAKWTAILTMAVDHYGKIVDPAVFRETHMIGRVAFPLFAAIIGLRLAARPDLEGRYLRRLILWAVISQPIYVLAGRHWIDGNIMVTLALGVGVVAVLRRHPGGAGLVLLGGIAVLSWFTSFGPLGVAMIPAMAILARDHPRTAVAAAGPLGVLANLRAGEPVLDPMDLTALLASPLLALSLAIPVRLPRLPGWMFYAFYPAHLLALHLYDLYG
ncbi:MAG: TraX family protein [Acidobacteriota bacterium]|jgi:hypothetical protein